MTSNVLDRPPASAAPSAAPKPAAPTPPAVVARAEAGRADPASASRGPASVTATGILPVRLSPVRTQAAPANDAPLEDPPGAPRPRPGKPALEQQTARKPLLPTGQGARPERPSEAQPPATRETPPAAPREVPSASTSPSPPPASKPRPEDIRSRWLLRTLTRVVHASNARHAARALVLHMASTLHCQRVALGWKPDKDLAGVAELGRLNMVAVSDLPRPADAPELVKDIEAAMIEAAQAGCTLSYPVHHRTDVGSGLAHVQLGRSLGASAVCSVPLGGHGRVLGVLTLQRDLGRPFGRHEVALLEEAAGYLAPLLAQHMALPKGRQAGASAAAVRWQAWRRRAPWILLAAAVLCSAWPVHHEVVAPARLQGLLERQVPAPRDGFVAAAPVRPGDRVQAGQLLLKLDAETLERDVTAAQAALHQAETAFGEALARHDQGQVVSQLAKVTEAQARLDIARADLERSAVQAGEDSLVLSGDWSHSLGAPVKRGDNLFTLAPDGRLRVRLWIDERDVADLSDGRTGMLRLAAMPAHAWPLSIERITPVARLQDGRNGFEADAKLNGPVPPGIALRPGLEGVARLDAGERPWIVSQGLRAWRWLRLQWWSWSA